MNGLNYHDEMVKNMMDATYQGNTIIPKETPVKIFTQEALEEHNKQIKAEVIDKCISTLKESYPLVDDNDILYGFGCAIHRLEQLKEEK